MITIQLLDHVYFVFEGDKLIDVSYDHTKMQGKGRSGYKFAKGTYRIDSISGDRVFLTDENKSRDFLPMEDFKLLVNFLGAG